MKRLMVILMFNFSLVRLGLAQDRIVTITGDTTICKITKIDSSMVFYTMKSGETYAIPLHSIIDIKYDYMNEKKTFDWFNFGLGAGIVQNGFDEKKGFVPSTVIGYSVLYRKSLFSFRYILNFEFPYFLSSKNPLESVWDLGILYGRGFTLAPNGFASLSGGVSLIHVVKRGEFLSSVGGLLFPDKYYKKLRYVTVGIPIECQIILTQTSHCGLSINGYANINSKKSFVGALLCLQFGTLR